MEGKSKRNSKNNGKSRNDGILPIEDKGITMIPLYLGEI
jgi:hypothetical protein